LSNYALWICIPKRFVCFCASYIIIKTMQLVRLLPKYSLKLITPPQTKNYIV